MSREPLHRIDPTGCGCDGCHSGFSQPFNEHGDTEQFHLLLHQEVTDSVGYDSDDWMTAAVELCPHRFAAWIADQIRSGRLLSRQVLQAKAASHVLGTLLDD
jgi:hypothetical protein